MIYSKDSAEYVESPVDTSLTMAYNIRSPTASWIAHNLLCMTYNFVNSPALATVWQGGRHKRCTPGLATGSSWPQEIKPSGRTHSLGSAVLFSRIFPTLTRNRGRPGASGRSGARFAATHSSPSITGSSLSRPLNNHLVRQHQKHV